MSRRAVAHALRASWLCALLLLLRPFALGAGTNTWTPLGPEGGDVLSIVIDPGDPQVGYAATYGGGVFKTTDGGASWTHAGTILFDGQEAPFITALALDPSNPSTLYAASNVFLFRSDDSGATWSELGAIDYGSIWLLRVVPGTPTRIYAGTNYPDFEVSEDGGQSWKLLHGGYDGVYLTMAVDPGNRDVIYAGGLGVSVAKSTDGGKTWTDLPPYSVYSLALDPTAPETLYLGLYGYGMYKSIDGGLTPIEINNGLTERHVVSVVIEPSGHLWAGTDGGGVFRSVDGGDYWMPSNTGLTSGSLETIVLDPTDAARLWIGTQGAGVFRSTNSGASWSPRSSGIDAATVEIVATHPLSPSSVFAGLRGVGLATSGNGGTSWTIGPSGPAYPDFRGMSFDPSDPKTAYAAQFGGLVKTTDAGASWADKSPTGYQDFRAVTVAPSEPDTVYAAAFKSPGLSSIFKSVDRGDHWIPANDGLGARSARTIAIDPADASTAYAIAGGYLYKTENGAGFWDILQTGGASPLYAVAVDPVDPRNVYAAGYGIIKSADKGASWVPVSSGGSLDSISSLTIDPSNPNILYAISGYGGLLKSIDGARNWDALTRIGDGRFPSSLAIDPQDHAHVFGGVFGAGVFEMKQVPPVLGGIFPASGPSGGGAAVTLAGAGFELGATVRVGTTPASAVSVIDEGTLRATMPALPTGFEDVTVVNPSGQAAILRGSWFSDFSDVPQTYLLHDAIVRVVRAGITAGCGTGGFCPDAAVNRGQAAVFLLRAEHGPEHHPPSPSGTVFADVPKDAFASAWIEELAAEGVTKGCGGGNFCPAQRLTRGEVSVLLLRLEHGPGFLPPDPTGVFSDVPAGSLFARWIEQLSAEAITSGCGGGRFCPNDLVTRAHLAAFLARAFHLP